MTYCGVTPPLRTSYRGLMESKLSPQNESTPYTGKPVEAARLMLERSRRNWSQEQAAEALGVSLRQYQRYEKEGNIPSRRLAAIAQFFGLEVSEFHTPLDHGDEEALSDFSAYLDMSQSKKGIDRVRAQLANFKTEDEFNKLEEQFGAYLSHSAAYADHYQKRSLGKFIVGHHLAGQKDLPVYAAAQGGPDGEFIIGFDPIDFVKRPSNIPITTGGFGIEVIGESMMPVFRETDIALVNTKRPPRKGDDVVLISTDNQAGEVRALIKRLVSESSDAWVVEQFNPPSQFTLKKQTWQQCLLVSGSYRQR